MLKLKGRLAISYLLLYYVFAFRLSLFSSLFPSFLPPLFFLVPIFAISLTVSTSAKSVKRKEKKLRSGNDLSFFPPISLSSLFSARSSLRHVAYLLTDDGKQGEGEEEEEEEEEEKSWFERNQRAFKLIKKKAGEQC